MFGIGGSEILVILIVALLFLGPDKMPDAARQISKGIRDLKRGSRQIQQTIENDETIGGAIRDLKSAMRGEDPPPPRKKAKAIAKPAPVEIVEVEAETPHDPLPDHAAAVAVPAPVQLELPTAEPKSSIAIKLAPDAGEIDPDLREGQHDREELAALIRPASGTVAKGEVEAPAAIAAPAVIEPKHG